MAFTSVLGENWWPFREKGVTSGGVPAEPSSPGGPSPGVAAAKGGNRRSPKKGNKKTGKCEKTWRLPAIWVKTRRLFAKRG